MRKRILSLASLMLLISVILAACGGTTPATSTVAPTAVATTAATTAPTTGGTDPTVAPTVAPTTEATVAPTTPPSTSGNLLTVSAQQQPTWVRNFNPFSGDTARWPTQNGIYEPLMIFNSIKGELVPWLATAYEWSADNKTLTFTIRDGVKWSDGEALTAEDVAFTFNLLREHAGLNGTAGANAGMAKETGYVQDVKADGNKVVFTFSRVYTPGLHDLAQQNIVPEHIWSKIADPVKETNENPVGSGPFTKIGRFEDQYYEILKNDNYWQPGIPKIDGLRFPAIPGNDAATQGLVSGEIDWAGNFLPDIQSLYVDKDPENFGYWFPPTGADVMLYVNTLNKPFDDPNVRKAISMAIDREEIVEIAMYDYTHPADATGLSDAYEGWKDAAIVEKGKPLVTRDVDAANALLDEAGLTKGADGIRVLPDGTKMEYDINVVNGWTDWVQAVGLIAEHLEEVGMKLTVQAYDFNAWSDKITKGEIDFSIGWSSGGATPFTYYRDQFSSTSFKPTGEVTWVNWARYDSKEGTALLDAFAATSDEAEQKAIASQLQDIFVTELPAIPLFPGPQWYERSTRKFTGLPDANDPYAVGSTYALERLLLLTKVQPK